ncbi:MAG: hypothetical protein IJU57_07610 [Clostridia bacterium]|nr:hypothetical protein [Clostridia bacterium]
MGNFRDKLVRFLYGRYGTDHLYYFMFAIWIIISVAGLIVRHPVFYVISIVIMLLMIFRSMSKNIEARRKENAFFLKFFNPVKREILLLKDRIRDIKTARYRKCRHCKALIKLPKVTGRHTVKCPKCGGKFDVRIIF